MTRTGGLGFVGNTFANLMVGAATLGYAVIVPAVVVRRYGTDPYGDWYLAFQVAAYVLLLDLGSQHVVIREAADPTARSEAAKLTTAAVVAHTALGLAVVAVAVACAGLAGEGAVVRLMAILGVGAIASLAAATVRAWFAGLERSHEPAVWLVGARAAALAGLGVAVAAGSGLVTLTIAVVAPQLLVHAGLLAWARRPPSPWARPDRTAFVRLTHSTLPLAVWTVCGVLIGGVDIFIVRVLDPSEVGRYAIALPLLAVPFGVATAAMSAWLPRIAQIQATDPEAGRQATLTATTVAAAALSVGAVPFFAYADEIVRIWAGSEPAGSAVTYLRLLYLATMLRFVFLPWALLILARGQQRSITAVPVAEALVNLGASVALGLWLGATGVAVGTLAGAVVATVAYLVWAVPRTVQSRVTSVALLRAVGAAWPPVVAATAVSLLALSEAARSWRGIAAAAFLAIAVTWAGGRRRGARVPVAVKPT